MDYKVLKDQELVANFCSGSDQNVFGEIYNRHFDIVYRYVFIRTGDRNVTEDIVSETFSTLLVVLKNFNGASKLSTFILGIALNKLRQYWQSSYNKGSIELEEEFYAAPTDEEDDEIVESKLEKLMKIVKDILADMPEKYRKVLETRFIENCSVKETAEKLGITVENTKVIQNRAIKKAKEIAQNLLVNKILENG